MGHPAKFTPAILDVLRHYIEAFRLPVHDPFAGTGERLGRLCDELGVPFSGTEIEREFIVDPRVWPGDSTDRYSYPVYLHRPYHESFMIVTSPVYPNGMTDHQRWKSDSKWKWNTYRHGLARITGKDRPLHMNNMGRYGNRHRRSRASEERHWGIARQCVKWWPNLAIVNVKDVVATSYTVPVVDCWVAILRSFNYTIDEIVDVSAPGNREGANRDLRADHEAVIVARR